MCGATMASGFSQQRQGGLGGRGGHRRQGPEGRNAPPGCQPQAAPWYPPLIWAMLVQPEQTTAKQLHGREPECGALQWVGVRRWSQPTPDSACLSSLLRKPR